MRALFSFAAQYATRAQVEIMPLSAVNPAMSRVRPNQARYRIVLENR